MNPEAIKRIIESLEKNGGVALDALAAYKAASAYGDLVLMVLAPLLVLGAARCVCKMARYAGDAPDVPYGSSREILGTMGAIASGITCAIALATFLNSIFSLPGTLATIRNPKGAAIHSLFHND